MLKTFNAFLTIELLCITKGNLNVQTATNNHWVVSLPGAGQVDTKTMCCEKCKANLHCHTWMWHKAGAWARHCNIFEDKPTPDAEWDLLPKDSNVISGIVHRIR